VNSLRGQIAMDSTVATKFIGDDLPRLTAKV
jgi:hypothetical protein